MNGFTERIGLPVLIQIIVEGWNGIFLLLLISVMIFGIRRHPPANGTLPSDQ